MEPTSVFASWGLSSEILQAIKALEFENPTPVQEAVVPFLLETGGDVVVLAKTGTGKTAAFGIPLVQKLRQEPVIQALVLCPTRELAAQVAKNLEALGRFKGLHVTSILGGESYRRQIDSLRRGPQIVVSTPGRLVDLLEQNLLDISGVQHLVLDEADEMLSFGFQESLKTIRERLTTPEMTTWLFSATMSSNVQRLSQEILKDPKKFQLTEKATPLNIESYAAVIYEEDKERALALLLRKELDFYGIIFAQTKKQVADLEHRFNSMGLATVSLHGDKPQVERTKVLERLRRRDARILVATDVAARGLDIEDLTHVVNFEIPWDVETYTHRIGRTARAGKSGTVWTLVRPKEAQSLRKFERALNFKFQNLRIPSMREVMASQVKAHLNKLLDLQLEENQQDFFNDQLATFSREKNIELSDETRNWVIKALSQSGLQTKGALSEAPPRTFEFRGSDSMPRPERQGGFRRDDRQGGFRDRGPRRSFGGAPRESQEFFAREEGGFRKENGFRRENRDGNFRRDEGGFRDHKPGFRREDGGGFRKENGFRRDGDFKPRFRDGDSAPAREGGFGPSREGGFGPPKKRAFKPRASEDGAPSFRDKAKGFKKFDKAPRSDRE